MNPKQVAIVHDYFYSYGGAEKTVESWLELYPNAVIYTNFITISNFVGTIFEKLYHSGQLKVTGEQKLLKDCKPKLFKFLFWLHPIMARFGIKISKDTDLVLLSSVYCAKYVKLPNNIPVVHYCHSPTRFLYSGVMRTELNHEAFPWYIKLFTSPAKFLIRIWDQQIVKKLINSHTTWLTNSSYNQQITQQLYHVSPEVIYPPIELSRFVDTKRLATSKQTGFVLFGRIVPIKKIERAILACIETNSPLAILGSISNEDYLQELKQLVINYPNKNSENLIQFVGDVPDSKKIEYFGSAKALLFPGLEDFGIVPIELMAAGIPVISVRGAGALEYITEGINGSFFEEGKTEFETLANLKRVLVNFDPNKFDSQTIKDSVRRFDHLHTTQFKEIISTLK
jgi:glycosyltransferase involved in cell wall biosynthesis